MRKELFCPVITKDGRSIGYGGDQEWFPGEFQRLAGCGSVTGSNMAAIYSHGGMEDLYPGNSVEYTDYLQLMETMYQYMKPGFMGYPLIGRFAKDFVRYAKERGISMEAETMFAPKDPQKSIDFITKAIGEDHPVAFLILRHPAWELREDNWHWVTITGYDSEKELFIWSNCGEREEISWKLLFPKEASYYIGMVKFQQK